MKVLHSPSNVANQSWSQAEGLRALGHVVEIWNYGVSPNGFPVDRVLDVGQDVSPYFLALEEALGEGFDVFNFHTARSLIPARKGVPQMWDLPILRALGKRVVFSFHGSDVRLAGHHRDNDKWSFYNFAEIPCDEEKIATRLAIIRTYAHHLTVSSVLDQVYVPDATYVPKSLHLEDYVMCGPTRSHRPRVLHATRRRATKGTDVIEELLERLQRELDFDYQIVEGVGHTELLKHMNEADIVVEKLFGGDAGVISLEAMALGKVAVARIRDEVHNRHPNMPVVSANPDNFFDVMKRLLSDFRLRRDLGEQGRLYVEHEHSGLSAAVTLEALYTSARPGAVTRPMPDWGADPSLRRLEGAFQRVQDLEVELARLKRRLSS